MDAPDNIYLFRNPIGVILNSWYLDSSEQFENIEYVRRDVFIDKAAKWIKENITNNSNANSVLVRNGCVTLGMLVDDFKKYMEQ